LVDDDHPSGLYWRKRLREDLPTCSFTNLREVLAALDVATEEDGPQILVSDIRMPGGSGLELLEKVSKKLPGFRHHHDGVF
jgi:two-component system nitrogen regulation response regulator GlnG